MVKVDEDKYSALPPLTVMVTDDIVTVDNPATVTCAVGGGPLRYGSCGGRTAARAPST